LAGGLLVSLLLLDGWGLWVQARTPLKADFRSATAYVAQHLASGDLLIFQIPHGRYSFDYYFRRQEWPKEGALQSPPSDDAYRLFLPFLARGQGAAYRWADGLYTNGGLTVGEVDRRMREVTGGSRAVWLIATEVPMWMPAILCRAGWRSMGGCRRQPILCGWMCIATSCPEDNSEFGKERISAFGRGIRSLRHPLLSSGLLIVNKDERQ
jgi:hypothetical protein